MLSKAQNKHISALRTKKYRTEHSQFIVEGKKSLIELFKSDFSIKKLYYTETHADFVQNNTLHEKELITTIEFEKISAQKKPEGLLAIVQMPEKTDFALEDRKYIALDKIRDPGNMGTIVRLADWFGIQDIICSTDCVELYNSKTVQASMGSIFHIKAHYVDLVSILKESKLRHFAATLDGDVVYELPPTPSGVLVIGNEANGISAEVLALCKERVTIPNIGNAESLNAAMACGILCSHLFR